MNHSQNIGLLLQSIDEGYFKKAWHGPNLREKRVSFPINGSIWFKRPDELSKEAWQQDVALLDDMHSMMRETIAQLKSSDLDEAAHGSKQTNRYIISGVAMHDVYHAGQVQLIKRLM
ncbi:MAG: hypothetical protein HY277_01625 [Ignavibacteriales bacterium]|nr:hypothetical protein [Ignavibacteriales bacterium]